MTETFAEARPGFGRALYMMKKPAEIPFFKITQLLFWLLLLYCGQLSAQTCKVTTSVPATPPKGGIFEIMVPKPYPTYAIKPARIYDTYDTSGTGPYIEIDTASLFWRCRSTIYPGPMNRCAIWGAGFPKKIGISVCVKTPAAKTYYFGFACDNAGTLTIDGDTILRGIGFDYWGMYKYNFSKGQHLIEFSVVNFEAEAAMGFELYNNTPAQIQTASGYGQLNLLYSTRQEFGAPVQEGDPDSTYSCPVGTVVDYCNGPIPLCTSFVPISLKVNSPAPACHSTSVDITDSAVTAGSPTSLTYSYWKDAQATIPLQNPQKVTQTGTYYIEGTYNDCQMVAPVSVVINAVTTNIYKDICPGESFMGHSKSGSYTDRLVAASGCDSLVTLNLTVSSKVSLGPDRILCHGDTLLLNPGQYSQYQWQDNTTSPQYLVTTPGTYSVRVTDSAGCSSADTVVISAGSCSLSKIPNTFTPNGDGVNDTWKLDALHDYPQCVVTIYNRWGQQVFYSMGYSNPWDGTQGGKKLPGGTYYYVIDLENNAPPVGGFVTIIR